MAEALGIGIQNLARRALRVMTMRLDIAVKHASVNNISQKLDLPQRIDAGTGWAHPCHLRSSSSSITRMNGDAMRALMPIKALLGRNKNCFPLTRGLYQPKTATADLIVMPPLRMFLDTITAQSANEYGRNALEVLDQKVGWLRLLSMKPELESMVEDNEASPLALAAEQYATLSKYAGAFLQAFTFQSARRHDPLLAAISL